MKIINKVKDVFKDIISDIGIPSYILWWILRGLMIYASVRQTDTEEKVLASLITLSMFTLSIFKFFAPKKSFVSRLSFNIQTLLNIMAFCGSFLGNYICMRQYYFNFDRVLHSVSGILCTLIGYYIFRALFEKTGIENKIGGGAYSLSASGFSFAVMVLWEIMEFGGDFFFGSNNQAYRTAPSNIDWWYFLFGPGKVADGAQFPLWDTILDMSDAVFTTLITALIICISINIRNKKQQLKEKEKEQVMA